MLTREEIAALPAGKILNATIAEHVLGYVWVYNKRYGCLVTVENAKAVVEGKHASYGKHPEHESGAWIGPLESYSTDIAYAWPLFAGNGWILHENKWNDVNPWFIFPDERALADWTPLACAPTVELAICHAKLAAHFLAANAAPSPSPLPPTEKEPA